MIRKHSILDRDPNKRESKGMRCIDCGNLLSQVENKTSTELIGDSKRCPGCIEINRKKVLGIKEEYFPLTSLSKRDVKGTTPESLQSGSGGGVLGGRND